MPFQLVVVRGRSATNHHRLGPGVTVAGRQEGCQLQIKSSQVSRKHCELFEKNGRLIVKDLNSSNGTFVNGERVSGQQVLNAGDELSIGGVKFRVEPVSATTAARPSDTAVSRTVVPEVLPEDDFAIPIDEETVAESPPAPAAKAPPAPKKPKPAPVEETTELAESELGEDAVAEFLMDLNFDDDDKL